MCRFIYDHLCIHMCGIYVFWYVYAHYKDDICTIKQIHMHMYVYIYIYHIHLMVEQCKDIGTKRMSFIRT